MELKEKYNLLIGSHVSMSGKDGFLASVKEGLSYQANALMLYTGAPQNTIRKPLDEDKITQGLKLLEENQIPFENVIVHAPYIINLCSEKADTRDLAVKFLELEIKRCEQIRAKYLVLHPGSRLKQDLKTGLKQVVDGLNTVFNKIGNTEVVVCIETMAGKGSEVGINLDELKTILEGVKSQKNIGLCLDTCHMHDAGYKIEEFNKFLEELDEKISLKKVKVIHLNDSKNPLGAHKDRHENIGYGYIGFKSLLAVAYHPKLENVVKILETPWVCVDEQTKKSVPIYKYEIEMLRQKVFLDPKAIIKNFKF